MTDDEGKLRGNRGAEDRKYMASLESRFGLIGNFWGNYEGLADRTDKEMSKTINDHLEVLLISAGLFAALNTAFICVSIPSLYSNSSDEINNLLRLLVLRLDNHAPIPPEVLPPFSRTPRSATANSFLILSLCLSITATFGALVGKEWLRDYDWTGQSILFEERGRQRQQKYNAAKRWHLEDILQSLSNILLLAVLLFFSGLIQLLLPVNKVAAAILIAFVGILFAAAMVAGTRSKSSLDQNKLPWALHSLGRGVFPRYTISATVLRLVWSLNWLIRVHPPFGSLVRRLKGILHLGGGFTETEINTCRSSTAPEEEDEILRASLLDSADDVEMLNTQAAYRMLTAIPGDQFLAAQTICNLPAKTCHVVIQNTNEWKDLLLLTLRSLQHWGSQPKDRWRRDTAETFGVALYHSLIGFSRQSVPWKTTLLALPSQLFDPPKGYLQALESILRPCEYKFFPAHIAGNHEFAELNSRMKRAVVHSEIFSSSRRLPWWVMARVLKSEYDDSILCMIAIHIAHCHIGQRGDNNASIPPSGPQYRKDMPLEAYDGENLGSHILDALNAGIRVFDESLDNWDDPVKVYLEFLKKMQILAALDETINEPLLISLASLVTKIGCTSSSKPGSTGLTVELLRTMKPSAISQSHIQDSVSEGFWHGLDHIVQAFTAARYPYSEREKLEGLIFDTLDLETSSPISTSSHAARIKNHPRIATWLASQLGGMSFSYDEKWLKLMNKFEAEWFDCETSYQRLWAECSLGRQLIGHFKNVCRAADLYLISPILLRVIRFEAQWRRQEHVDGLVSTSRRLLNDICGSRERFSDSWRGDIYLVMEIPFQVWEFFERDRANDGANAKMAQAFQGVFYTLESSLPREEQRGTGFHDQLLHFTEYIQQRRGIPALISHNFDVTLNRLYADSDKKVEWGYQSYGQPRTPSCGLKEFVNDGLL